MNKTDSGGSDEVRKVTVLRGRTHFNATALALHLAQLRECEP